MRFQHYFVFSFLTIFGFSCSKNESIPLQSTVNANQKSSNVESAKLESKEGVGALNLTLPHLSLPEPKEKSAIARYILKISGINGFAKTVEGDYQSGAELKVTALPPGEVALQLEISLEGVVVKSGAAKVEVLAGKIAIVDLELHSQTGDLIVIVKDKPSQCHVKLDHDYIESMFQNSECLNFAMGPNEPNAFDYKLWSKVNNVENISSAISSVKSPLSKCQIKNEISRLAARARVQCGNLALQQEGSSLLNSLSPELQSFILGTAILSVNSTVIGTKFWSKQSAVAASSLFGNPDRYFSMLQKFRVVMSFENLKEASHDDLLAAKKFLNILNEYVLPKDHQEKIGASIDEHISLAEYLDGMKPSNAVNFFDMTSERESLTDRLSRFRHFSVKQNLNYLLEEREGTFNFYPKVAIFTAVEISRRLELARELNLLHQ